MARMSVIMVAVVAIALVQSAAASEIHPDPPKVIPEPRNVEVDIHNHFKDDKLTVQCESNTKKYPAVHLLHPREVYKFSFNPHIQRWWVCTIATVKKDVDVCGAIHSGKFGMWQTNMPAHCQWIVDKYGLWLIRDGKLKPVRVYKWPVDTDGC